MAIAQKLAGYSLGKADLLRRAMGKKKKEILDKEFVPFRDGMQANGYSDAGHRHALGRCWFRSPTMPSTRPTPLATAWSLLDGLSESQLSRPSTWRPC